MSSTLQPGLRQYRKLAWGDQILVGGDCSQGGADENWCQFLCRNRLDLPMVYQKPGVAAEMTTDIYPVLVSIFKQTGIKPVVAFERNNGGASEMNRLDVLNREGAYDLFLMPQIGMEDVTSQTTKLGWDTTTVTRAMMLGDLKNAINNKVFKIYDQQTVRQLYDFIVNKQGKPEASPGKHDDAVMALAIVYQLFLRVEPRIPIGGMQMEDDVVDKHAVIPTI